MKYKKRYFTVIAVLCLLVLMYTNSQFVRNIVARHFGTVASGDAIRMSEEKLAEYYPNKTFEWLSGDYYDIEGNRDDSCYTSTFMVDGEADNLINVTYSDNDYESIWEGNVNIEIDEKAYERKTALISRLASDYTQLFKKETWKFLREFVVSEADVSIITPYQNKEYTKAVPLELYYGMELNLSVDWEWELKMIIRCYEEGMELKIMDDVRSGLEEEGFRFKKYNFVFIDGDEENRYIYDGETLSVCTEEY